MKANEPSVNTPPLEQVEAVKAQICVALGIDPNRPPLYLTESQTAAVLHVKVGSLRVWRCTKRYPLPIAKIGKNVRYPLNGVAEFYLSRING
jgi:hypothetical protein